MEEKSFFYIDKQGVQQGPRSIHQLENEYVIKSDTMVWSQGMKNWCRAGEVEELQAICNSYPPVIEEPIRRENCSAPQPTEPCPHTWLIESILSTVLCCLIFGIIGIIYASKVESLWAKGCYAEAKSAAKTAKLMFILGVSITAFCLIVYLFVIIFFSAAMTNFM